MLIPQCRIRSLLTCLRFRIQKDGSLKVYIDDVSRASYESSQYCVSFTDLPDLEEEEEEEEEGMMEGNTTAMIMMEDPDLIEDCSDIFTDRTYLHNVLINSKNVPTLEGDNIYVSEQIIFS